MLYVVAAEGDVSVHDDTPATAARSSTTPEALTSFGMLDGSLRFGTPQLSGQFRLSGQVDGKIGITNEDHTAYAADARFGAEMRIRPFRYFATAGLAVDAYGPELPRAWTVPVDVTVQFDDHSHHGFGVHGGPRFSITGDRGAGANVGLEYRLRDHFCEQGRFDPRDLLISVDANWVADHTFVGLTVGFGNPRGRQWWEE